MGQRYITVNVGL